MAGLQVLAYFLVLAAFFSFGSVLPAAVTPASSPSAPIPDNRAPFPSISFPPIPAAQSPTNPSEPAPTPAAYSPLTPIFFPPKPAYMPAPVSSPPEPEYMPPVSAQPEPAPVRPSKGVKAAYWPSFDSFPVSSIDTSYFTHVYYAFLLPDPVTYKLAITTNDQNMLPSFSATLKTQKPTITTMLSIGGAGNDPKVFAAIANTSSNRAILIQSAITISRQYGFDGVDLDWEFPLDQQDMNNLGTLYKEWRIALKHEAKATGRTRLLFTAAVYYASTVPLDGVIRSYPAESMRKHLDWISPMCFDYHGSWDKVTGLHSALYDPNSTVSTESGIKSWINAGVPKKKLVMGLPVYGHTWTLEDPNVHGVGAPATGIGPGDQGTLTYLQVVDFNNKNNATLVYDMISASVYSYAGDIWIGYDDPMSVWAKVQFAYKNGLRGYFFWALGQDLDWSISKEAAGAWRR